ncbi:hypothetical protein C7413_12845 [Paraburkholderia silvatlantica]|nr:hypothetical protein C7411_12945 [Paraburkholderia silvatlantica]PXW30448.1 hypothetical protein C7413_12845 [Paraburkholderia silvatlantica]
MRCGYRAEEIYPRQWIAQGQRVGFAAAEVEAMLAQVAAQPPRAIEAVAAQIPAGFPADVADTVFAGMRRLTARLTA